MDKIDKVKKMLKTKIAENVIYKRFGSEFDGGYILVNDINKNDFAISCGIDNNIDWEKDFLTEGLGIHCYDYSIDCLPEQIDNTIFFKEKVGVDVNLSEMINRVDSNYDIILKMDIEGAEWDVLPDITNKDLSRIRQITIEFHYINHIDDDKKYLKMINSFEKLLNTHTPVWIHANNWGKIHIIDNKSIPEVVEVTYLRNSDYVFLDHIDLFAGLNKPNNPNLPEIDLVFP